MAVIVANLYSLSLFSSITGIDVFIWGMIALIALPIVKKEIPRSDFFKYLPDKKVIQVISLLLLVVLVSTFFNTSDFLTFFRVTKKFRWILCLFVLTFFCKRYVTELVYKKVVFTLAIFTSIHCFYCFFQFFCPVDFIRGDGIFIPPLSGTDRFFRPSGFFNNTVTAAFSFSVLFIIFSTFIEHYKNSLSKKSLYFYRSVLILISITILLSFSRGPMISLLVVFLCFNFRKNLKKVLSVSLLLILFFVAAYKSNSVFSTRINESINLKGSVQERYSLLKAHWRLFIKNPLIGVGYFRTNNREYIVNALKEVGAPHARPSHAHNSYLQFFSSFGVFGGVFFILFLSLNFIKTLKLYKKINAHSFSGLIITTSLLVQTFFIFSNMFDFFFNSFFVYQYLYFLALRDSNQVMNVGKTA